MSGLWLSNQCSVLGIPSIHESAFLTHTCEEMLPCVVDLMQVLASAVLSHIHDSHIRQECSGKFENSR